MSYEGLYVITLCSQVIPDIICVLFVFYSYFWTFPKQPTNREQRDGATETVETISIAQGQTFDVGLSGAPSPEIVK